MVVIVLPRRSVAVWRELSPFSERWWGLRVNFGDIVVVLFVTRAGVARERDDVAIRHRGQRRIPAPASEVGVRSRKREARVHVVVLDPLPRPGRIAEVRRFENRSIPQTRK